MTEKDQGNLERAGAGMGGLAGKAADTAVDLMGSMIRRVAGSVGGWWSDRSTDEASTAFGDREESTCRQHFELNRSQTTSYDAVRPLYQFGHLAGSNPDYQGRSFEEVEPDLRTAWSGDQSQRYGDWDTVRDYVSTGYRARNSRGSDR
ncbi:MAG TPA: hypothetical protein VF021_06970 [Longimicrobiales bacterium]